ncbi:MAG: LysM peptidoglycan-binding domain-containing protein [Candidatus Kapaibacterium sp.]
MRTLLALLAFGLLATPAFSQMRVDPNKPDSLLKKDEAEIRIEEFRNRVANLKSELDALTTQVNEQNSRLTALTNELDDCNKAIYALIGATEADVNAFRERLGKIEARVREMQRMSDEDLSKRISEIDKLWADLNELRKNKIAALPEFYDKIVGLARDIKQLYERARNFRGNTYTVGTWKKDRDCLWNIAKKDDIYSDPFMWPKIWQANTDQIRNPDLIMPGQVLRIPPPGPKTDEELRAERLYYRQKREAAQRAAASRRARQVESNDAGSGN